MTIFDHVKQKAQSIGLDLIPTLGRDYILILPFRFFNAVNNAEFKGSLYECNFVINGLINKNIKRGRK